MIVNTTPHPLKIFAEDKKTVLKVFPVSKDFQIRLKIKPQQKLNSIMADGKVEIPVFTSQEFTDLDITGDLQSQNFYIVSQMVLDWAKIYRPVLGQRFYAPDTNVGAVREEGAIVGTTRLLK